MTLDRNARHGAEARRSPIVVWRRTRRGEGEHIHSRPSDIQTAINEAAAIARSSGDEGAMSVWVEHEGAPVWAAGEKAREMIDSGVEIDYHGNVR